MVCVAERKVWRVHGRLPLRSRLGGQFRHPGSLPLGQTFWPQLLSRNTTYHMHDEPARDVAMLRGGSSARLCVPQADSLPAKACPIRGVRRCRHVVPVFASPDLRETPPSTFHAGSVFGFPPTSCSFT